MTERIKTTDRLVSILKGHEGEYAAPVQVWLNELGVPRFSFYYALDKLAGQHVIEYNKRWEASDPDRAPFMIYTAHLLTGDANEAG